MARRRLWRRVIPFGWRCVLCASVGSRASPMAQARVRGASWRIRDVLGTQWQPSMARSFRGTGCRCVSMLLMSVPLQRANSCRLRSAHFCRSTPSQAGRPALSSRMRPASRLYLRFGCQEHCWNTCEQGPTRARPPRHRAAQLSSALPRGCRHRALRAVISTAAKDTASATRTARRARAERIIAAGATATTAATFARGITSAARAAPQRCPKY